MTIITSSGERPQTFHRVEAADESPVAERTPLVPFALLSAFLERHGNGELGLSVPNDAEVDAIAPYFPRLSLISVEFPAFSDGRGLSLAKRLRRAGFEGILRASGPLIADQFAEALACGFDEVELPATMANRQPVQQWLEAKDRISGHYQRGYRETRSILEQRRAARAEA